MQAGDAGSYTCRAENALGREMRVVHLEVQCEWASGRGQGWIRETVANVDGQCGQGLLRGHSVVVANSTVWYGGHGQQEVGLNWECPTLG